MNEWEIDDRTGLCVYKGDGSVIKDVGDKMSGLGKILRQLGLLIPGLETESRVKHLLHKMRVLGSSESLYEEQERPKETLPDLKACLYMWEDFYSDLRYVTSEQINIATTDCMIFLKENKDAILEQLNIPSTVQNVEAGIASIFLFTYQLLEPVIWCILDHGTWSVMPEMHFIEKHYDIWMTRNGSSIISLTNATIDFETETWKGKAGVMKPVKRVTTQDTGMKYKQCVWWAAGSIRRTTSAALVQGVWKANVTSMTEAWLQAPDPINNILEGLWTSQSTPWEITSEIQEWLINPFEGGGDDEQGREPELTPLSSPRFARRSSSRHEGSILWNMRSDLPPEPNLSFRKGSPTAAHELSYLQTSYAKNKHKNRFPPLVVVLKAFYEDDFPLIRSAIQGFEVVRTHNVTYYVNFEKKIMVQESASEAIVYVLAGRLCCPLKVDVPLEASQTKTGRQCLEVVRTMLQWVPREEASGMCTIPSGWVDRPLMSIMRKGNIAVSSELLLMRKSEVGNISTDMTNIEILGNMHNVAQLTRNVREGKMIVGNMILEIAVDFSEALESQDVIGSVLKEICEADIASARLRQLLGDCLDTRIITALTSAINGEQHIALNYSDPKSSSRKFRIDKQKNEKSGISELIPIIASYTPPEECSQPSLFGVSVEDLQTPHLSNVLITKVDHDSSSERVGIRRGTILSKVNTIATTSVAHASRCLRETEDMVFLSVTIMNPGSDYVIWEIRSSRGVSKVVYESAIIERAYQVAPTKPFRVDAALKSVCVVLNPQQDEYYSKEHVPKDLLETLSLEFSSDDQVKWLQGGLPSKPVGTIVGCFKSCIQLQRKPAMRDGNSHLNRLGPADATGQAELGKLAELDLTHQECLANFEKIMQYPPEDLVEARREFTKMQKQDDRQRSAVLLLEAFFRCTKAKQIGKSARLRALYNFERWYKLSGLKVDHGVLYYCVSLDINNRLVVVHHSAVHVKDLIEYDFIKGTRRRFVNRNPSTWMVDEIQRTEISASSAVGDAGVEIMARAMTYSPKGVQHLSLDGNDLSNDCVPHLVRALTHNTMIRSVKIEENPRVKHIHKRSLNCLIKCNTFDCAIDHEDLDFLDLIKYVLQKRQEVLPANDLRTVLAHNALGAMYQKGAKMAEAEEHFKEAWRQAELNCKAKPSIEATHAITTIVYNLGTLYLVNGDVDNGKEAMIKSFESIISVAGPKHISVWHSLIKVADFYCEQREFERALFWYEFTTSELCASEGFRCPLIALAKQHAACVHIRNGEIRYALYDLLRAMNMLNCQLNLDEYELFNCTHKIAITASCLGHPLKAWALNDQALIRIESRFHERKVSLSVVAECTRTLADYYKATGEWYPPGVDRSTDFDKAAMLYEKAWEYYTHLIPMRHPEFLAVMLNKGAAYLHLGKFDVALPLLDKAAKLTEETLSCNHPMSAMALKWLGRHYWLLHDYKEAWILQKRAVSYLDTGEDKPCKVFGDILCDFGRTCVMRNMMEEAETVLLRSLKIRQILYGIDHDDIATSMSALSDLYSKMGMYEEAEDFAKRYVTLRFHRYPQTSLHLVHAVEKLAQIRKIQGKHFEAAELQKVKSVITKDGILFMHRPQLQAQIARLRGQLKAVGALYLMKDISWDARMQYIKTKAIRSYPLDLIRALPPFDPFKREPGVPISSIDQALKLETMKGLNRLVRHARVTDPSSRVWVGVKALERAVITASEVKQRSTLETPEDEIRPGMFGADDVHPVWTPPVDEDSHASSNVDIFFLNEFRETDMEDPVTAGLGYLTEQLKIRTARMQRELAEQLSLSTMKGILAKYYRLLGLWMPIAQGIREAESNRGIDVSLVEATPNLALNLLAPNLAKAQQQQYASPVDKTELSLKVRHKKERALTTLKNWKAGSVKPAK